MNTTLRILALSLAGTLSAFALNVVPAAAAAGKAYIDFGATGSKADLIGESIDAPKATWYPVMSFKFDTGKEGVTPVDSLIGSATGGAGAGKLTKTPATAESLHVTLGSDGAQKAFELAKAGRKISSVRLEILKPNKKNASKLDPAVSVLLSNVTIVSSTWTGKGDKASTDIVLDYERYEIDQAKTKIGPTGEATVDSWSQVQNKQTAADAWESP